MKENSHSTMSSLKEMLLDEHKLVTYLTLSKELCIHVNESKSLLAQMLQELRKNNKDVELNVNYIISGLLDDNKAHTAVCNEKDLSDLQTKFKTVFFQHLYSINIGDPGVDNVSFMAVNKFEDFTLCTGLIKSNLCIKRPIEEIGNLRTNALNAQEISSNSKNPVIEKKKVKEESKDGKRDIGLVGVSKMQQSISEPIIKMEVSKIEKCNSSVQKVDNKIYTKNKKGIAGFFNKASTSSKKPVNGTHDKVTEKHVETEEKPTVEVKSEKMDVDEDTSETKSTKDNDSTLKSNKSLDRIKKTAKVDKKRKRVLHVSDSESEEEKNDPFDEVVEPESEDEIPPTPLANTVKISSAMVNPKKKRKIVDKTYTGEDGYILTKKEEIYESCSENDEEPNVKENIKSINKVSPVKNTETSPKEKKNGFKNNKKKFNSPQKGKQSTLMSFFKKV